MPDKRQDKKSPQHNKDRDKGQKQSPNSDPKRTDNEQGKKKN